MEAQVAMTHRRDERPGFWMWVAVHAEMIPTWSWPALVLIDAVIVYLGLHFR